MAFKVQTGWSPSLEAISNTLNSIIDSNPGTPLADKVEDALATVQTALEELDKDPPDNQAAIGNLEGAVGDIQATVDDGLLTSSEGEDLMDPLTEIARSLAVDAIDQAIAVGGDQEKIDEAQLALDEGDALKASGDFKDAVNKYKDALAKAEGALP